MSIIVANPYTKQDEKIVEKIINIRVLTKSQEIKLLNQLTNHDKGYYDEELEKKIFNKYEFVIKSGKNLQSDLYLKNKYLYLTTRGVINYLRLYESLKAEENKGYYNFEIECIKNIISKKLEDNKKLSLISLGAANSDKEISAIEGIQKKELENLTYIPIDVSNYLIHLGIIDSLKIENLEINSIIADFWDLAKYIKEHPKKRNELFTYNSKLFVMLGGTFGNYTEEELLNQIIQMMELEDELLISVQFYTDINVVNQKLIDEYKNKPGNDGFLLEPLTYIPFYYGYSKYRKDLLKIDITSIVDDNIPQKIFISVVPESICLSPYIELPKTKFGIKEKLRLAWTTRYKYDKLKKWIEEYHYEDYQFEIIKDNKNCDQFIVENDIPKLANFGIMHLKKTYIDRYENIIKILSNNNKLSEKSSNFLQKIEKDKPHLIKIYNELQENIGADIEKIKKDEL